MFCTLKTVILAILLTACSINHSRADELTLYFWPSPLGFDWDGPNDLARTTVRNFLSKPDRKLGHAAIELKCDSKMVTKSPIELLNIYDKSALKRLSGEIDTEHHFYAGMTDTTSSEDYNKLLFKDKIGLYMLFMNFNGAMEGAKELLPDLASRYTSGRISFITFKINPQTCERLETYYKEYKSRGDYKNYGLPNRPRYGEGAGCTAYASSFLDVAGLLTQEHYDKWSMQVRVPMKWIGPPMTNHKVPFKRLIWPFGTQHWAKADEEGKDIFFWNPDRMFHWVNDKWNELDNSANCQTGNYELVMRQNAKGLIYDATKIETPTEPIWKN